MQHNVPRNTQASFRGTEPVAIWGRTGILVEFKISFLTVIRPTIWSPAVATHLERLSVHAASVKPADHGAEVRPLMRVAKVAATFATRKISLNGLVSIAATCYDLQTS